MMNNGVFNATVCIVGILILVIHVANILTNREKRKDENVLLDFFIFTIVHFATYLTFLIVNACVIAFYTTFYIMNNVEVFLLFRYSRSYMDIEPKKDKPVTIFRPLSKPWAQKTSLSREETSIL